MASLPMITAPAARNSRATARAVRPGESHERWWKAGRGQRDRCRSFYADRYAVQTPSSAAMFESLAKRRLAQFPA